MDTDFIVSIGGTFLESVGDCTRGLDHLYQGIKSDQKDGKNKKGVKKEIEKSGSGTNIKT